ncbi:MAG: hypothetical protein ACRYG8_29855 [Janthinobacterium lividum]
MLSYLNIFLLLNDFATPQSRVAIWKSINSAIGYRLLVTSSTQPQRFIHLGSQDGLDCSVKQIPRRKNVANVIACLTADSARMVARMVETNEAWTAPSHSMPALPRHRPHLQRCRDDGGRHPVEWVQHR